MNIPRKIKRIRELNNFTQEYMADSLDISQSSYNKIENGSTNLTVNRLIQIAGILEVELVSLLSFDEMNLLERINKRTSTLSIEKKRDSLNYDYYMSEIEKVKKELTQIKKVLKKDENGFYK